MPTYVSVLNNIGIGSNLGIPTWNAPIISKVLVTTTSGTTQTVTGTVVGSTGGCRFSFEKSTDRYDWLEDGTSANGNYNATGLTADIFYFWRIRPYKGIKVGSYSDIEFNITYDVSATWYLAGGISAANCKAAFAPCLASSLANSYINIAHPGTNDANPLVAPALSPGNGWVFSGSQYLDTGLVPSNDQSWSMVIKYSGYITGDLYLLGVYEGATKQFHIELSGSEVAAKIGNGSVYSGYISKESAILGSRGGEACVEGKDMAVISAGSGNFSLPIYIGTVNQASLSKFFTGKISAIAIYDIALTSTQMGAVSLEMNRLDTHGRKRYEYMKMGFGVTINFTLGTFYTGFPLAEQDVNLFNPTDSDITSCINEWVDVVANSGAKYIACGVKAEDGFNFYPSAYAQAGHSPYSIAQSSWYAANGSPDLLAIMIARCRKVGLRFVMIYEVGDKTFESRGGTGADYNAMNTYQINEIIHRYFDIYAFWFDTWGWYLSYAYCPWKPIIDNIRSLNPDCLFITNEQLHPSTHGDIDLYEASNAAPVGNVEYAEQVETIRTDGVWIYDPTKDQTITHIRTKSVLNNSISVANSRNSTYLLSAIPDRTGRLPVIQKQMLQSMGRYGTFWASLTSAVVNDSDPSKIILTFSLANTDLVASDFGFSWFTVTSLTRDNTNKIFTFNVSPSVINIDVISVTFNKTGETANITNNVLAHTAPTPVGVQPELTDYMVGLITPLSSGQQTLLNNFIISVKSAFNIERLSHAFDTLCIYAGETSESSLRNLVWRMFDSTLGGSPNPTYSSLRGFAGDGSHGYINTNYTPSVHNHRALQNSMAYGVYSRTNSSVAICDMGSIGTNRTLFECRNLSGKAQFEANQTTGGSVTKTTGATSLGLYVANRTASNVISLYQNGVYKSEDNVATTGLPTKPIYVGALNNEGSAALFSGREYSFEFISRALSTDEITALNNAIQTYMTANGYNV